MYETEMTLKNDNIEALPKSVRFSYKKLMHSCSGTFICLLSFSKSSEFK